MISVFNAITQYSILMYYNGIQGLLQDYSCTKYTRCYGYPAIVTILSKFILAPALKNVIIIKNLNLNISRVTIYIERI